MYVQHRSDLQIIKIFPLTLTLQLKDEGINLIVIQITDDYRKEELEAYVPPPVCQYLSYVPKFADLTELAQLVDEKICDSRCHIFTARKRSWRKIMFSQASVCSQGRLCLGAFAWGVCLGGCVPRGCFARGGGRPIPLRSIRSSGGRYASYWNAYFFKF